MKKKEINFNNPHISSNNNSGSVSPNYFRPFTTPKSNSLNEYELFNIKFIDSSSQANNDDAPYSFISNINNNRSSIDTYNLFYRDVTSSRCNTNNNDNLHVINEKILSREEILSEIKKMKPTISNPKEREELNKKFLEDFTKKNPSLKKLDTFFEVLHAHNPNILYSEALKKILELKENF